MIYHDPADDVIQKATTCTPSADIIDEVLVLDSKNKTVTFKSFGGCDGKDNKAELTFGAVGKGRAVDLFIDNYSDYSILINAGQSSVKTNKFKKGQEPWSLEIANPKFNEKMSILFDSYLVGSYFKVNSAEVYLEKVEISIFLLLDITTTTISHIKLVKLDHISSILKQDIQKPLLMLYLYLLTIQLMVICIQQL